LDQRTILLAHFFPFPTRVGAEIRTALVLKALARRGPVALVGQFHRGTRPDIETARAFAEEVIPVPPLSRSPVARLGKRLNCLSPLPPAGRAINVKAFEGAVRGLGPRWDSALLWLEASWLLPVVKPLDGRAVVLDQHNVDSLVIARRAQLAPRPLRWLLEGDRRSQEAFERRWFPKVSRFAAVSDEDARALTGVIPDPIVRVIPSALEMDRYPFAGRLPDEPVAIMTGHFGYGPNVEGAHWLCREVWPAVRRRLPGARLVLAGLASDALAEKLAAPGIEGTGAVEEMVPRLHAARVALVPILHGGGTRLKILEAMACGIPVLSTSAGAEGMEVRSGEHLWIEDAPAAFAERLLSLLGSDETAEAVRRAARARVEEAYSSEAFVRGILALADEAFHGRAEGKQ
jgi:glycosyltransferase involved in cell wall biosynthesis